MQNQLPTAGYGPTGSRRKKRNPDRGRSDRSAALYKLENVQQVQSSGKAFAAVLGDGSVGA